MIETQTAAAHSFGLCWPYEHNFWFFSSAFGCGSDVESLRFRCFIFREIGFHVQDLRVKGAVFAASSSIPKQRFDHTGSKFENVHCSGETNSF